MLYREENQQGQIIIGGIDVAKLRNNKVYKLRKLGIVFQDFNYYLNLRFMKMLLP